MTSIRRPFDGDTVALLGAGVAALLGLAVASVGTHLALAADETPVFLLPLGGRLLGIGFLALLAARTLTVLAAWVLMARWRPQYGTGALAVAGLCWFLWGTWQLWLLLART